jgi:hypothetical protein
MKSIGALLIFFCLLFSCKKENDIFYSFRKKCDQKATLDSLSTANLLIGTWKWTDVYCPCCKGSKPTKADKTVYLKFNSDATFIVTEDSKIIDSGKLKLRNYSSKNDWQIDLSGYSEIFEYNRYLRGNITICGTQLSIDDSPLDGCNNLYEKVK